MQYLPFDFSQVVSDIVGKVVNFAVSIGISILEPVFHIVVNLIVEALNGFLYEFLIIPMFKILDVTQQGIDIFAGARTVKYLGVQDTLLNIILFRSGISTAFWAITLIGICVAAAFAFATFTKAGTDEEHTVGKLLGRMGKTMLTFFLIPAVAMAGINLISMVMAKASESVTVIGAPEANLTISKVLFLAMTFGAEKDADPGAPPPTEGKSLYSGARAKYLLGPNNPNRRDYMNPKHVFSDFNKAKLLVIPGLLLLLFFLFLFLVAAILFVSRLIELALLYLVSPYFAAFIPSDDGEKFGQWRDVFIGKLGSGFGLMIGIKLYMMVLLPLIMSEDIIFFNDGIAIAGFSPDLMLRILLLAGFGLAMYKTYNIVTEAVSPQLAYMERERGKKATALVAMAATGGASAVARAVAGQQMQQAAGQTGSMPKKRSRGSAMDKQKQLHLLGQQK